MLNYIWLGLLVFGFTVGILNNRIEAVTQAAMQSAGNAVELCIGLLGIMCLWTGLMRIADKSGLIRIFARGIQYFVPLLFPGVPKKHPAIGAVVMNLAANMLGLGNAATPLGLKAISELQKLNIKKDTSTDAMSMFLVLNTSAVQLVPATIIAVRSAAGSASPAEITGAIWVASIFATITGVLTVKILSSAGNKRLR